MRGCVLLPRHSRAEDAALWVAWAPRGRPGESCVRSSLASTLRLLLPRHRPHFVIQCNTPVPCREPLLGTGTSGPAVSAWGARKHEVPPWTLGRDGERATRPQPWGSVARPLPTWHFLCLELCRPRGRCPSCCVTSPAGCDAIWDPGPAKPALVKASPVTPAGRKGKAVRAAQVCSRDDDPPARAGRGSADAKRAGGAA